MGNETRETTEEHKQGTPWIPLWTLNAGSFTSLGPGDAMRIQNSVLGGEAESRAQGPN